MNRKIRKGKLNSKKAHVFIGFSLLSMLFYLASCDPAIGYEYSINNQSDKELNVYFKRTGYNDSTKTVIVYPKTEVLFFETETWGKNPHDEKDNFLQLFDSLSITAADSSLLLLDYLKRENWSYDNDIGHLGFIKTGTNIYQLEIANVDFKKQ